MKKLVRTTSFLFLLIVLLFPAGVYAQIDITVNTTIASGDTSYDNEDIIVGNGTDPVTLTIDGSHTFSSLTVKNNATVTHSQTNTSTTYSLDITVTGDIDIQTGGTINVNGRGYIGGFQSGNSSDYGRTIGNVTTNGSSGRNGGSYGGRGGSSSYGNLGLSYGDLTDPTEPGAGGGGGCDGSYCGNKRPGGDGGGLVRMTIGGTFTHNGVITANGNNPGSNGTGGGAGGGIYINVDTIDGTGEIRANGASAGTYQASWRKGGGGGGRIAVHYTTETYTGTVTTYGGAGQHSGGNGGAGTIYWKGASQTYGDLIVDNNNLTPADSSTPLPASPTAFDNVTITNDGRVYTTTLTLIDNSFVLDDGWYNQNSPALEVQIPDLDVANGSNLLLGVDVLHAPSLSITNESNLTHLQTNSTQVYSLDLDITGAMSIDDTSTIDVNGRGYIGAYQLGINSDYGRTSGNVTTNGSNSRNGGTYGGLGGSSSSGYIGASYGDLTDPTEPGAGGGGGCDGSYCGNKRPGGDGGGLVRMTVGGTFTHNGVITANGNNPGGGGTGGGAGGGIYINADTVTGAGEIRANGASAGTYSTGWRKGGGGGGRIAVLYNTKTYTGTASAYGGTGYNGGGNSGAGTIYWKDEAEAYGDLVVDNNNNTPADLSTPLPAAPTIYRSLSITNDARVYSSTMTLVVTSFVLDDGWYNQNSPTTELIIPTLNVTNGSNLLLGVLKLRTPELSLTNESNLTHLQTNSSQVYSVDINVDGAMSIDETSTINVNGGGYIGAYQLGINSDYGRTSGNVTTNGSSARNGGSYGGLGGSSSSGYIGASYGDMTDPTEPGAGGGGGCNGSYCGSKRPGGDGGGLVRMTVGGTFTHNGVITANGNNPGSNGTGGGAGGGIYINVDTITGAGTIRANGANAGTYASSWRKGGGGGGRIAVHYTTETYTGTVTTYGGAGQHSGGNGGAGTIYWKGASQSYGDLIVDNNNLTPADSSTPLPASPTAFDNLTVTNDGRLYTTTLTLIDNSFVLDDGWYNQNSPALELQIPDLDVTNGSNLLLGVLKLRTPELSLTNESNLTHLQTNNTQVYSLELDITGAMNIDGTSTINVNGGGYIGAYQLGINSDYGRTSGNVTTNGSSARNGGSYGGLGGSSSSGYIGASYGDMTDPTEPGAGGGGGCNGSYCGSKRPGGDGGGLVRMTIGGTFTHNGVITANGNNPGSGGTGGGAGGGIYINVDTIDGTGTITANGGNAGTYNAGWAKGGGGGGRIAIINNMSSFLGLINVNGGTGYNGGGVGGEGTAYYSPDPVDLSITKSDSPDPVDNGETLTYTLTITNIGTTDATGVLAEDTLPAGVTYVSAVPSQGSCSESGGVVTCDLGNINSSGSATVTVTVTVATEWTVTNSALVYANQIDFAPENNRIDEVTTVNPADLSITKSASPDPVLAGELLTYTIIITNNGWQDAENTTLTDNISTQILTPEYSTDSGSNWDMWTGSLNIGTLNNGDSATILIRGTVDPANTGDITNSASVVSDRSDPDAANNQVEITTILNTNSDLTITGSESPDPVTAGTVLTYTFNISNAGPSDATNVILTDSLPAELQNQQYSTNAGAGWSSWGGSLNIGTLIPGASQEVLLRGTVASSILAALNNSASASSDVTDPNVADNDTGSIGTFVVTSADISIIMNDNPDPVVSTYYINYFITAANAGPSDALNVLLNDSIPAQVQSPEFSLDSGAAWNTWTGSNNLGTITSGSSKAVIIRGTVESLYEGTITNSAALSSDTTDPDSGNNATGNIETVSLAGSPTEIITSNTTIDATDYSYDGRYIVVGNGTDSVTLTINGIHEFPGLTVMNNSTVTHSDATPSSWYSMDLTIRGDLDIQAGGRINVNSRGYLGGWRGGNNTTYGRTTGNVTNGCTWNADGASYGGVGGNGSNGGAICAAYGDLTNPDEPGSGGGAWQNGYPGGDGGGLVRLSVEGTLTNNGVISANGGNSGQLAGGGSGGAIYINTSTLVGNGTVSANGGVGAANGHYNGYLEAGGGGGRIAIYYDTRTYTGTANAYGGAGYSGGGNAGAGTVYWKGDAQSYGDLVVDNNNVTPADSSTPLPSTPTAFDNVTITNDGRVYTATLTLIDNSFVLDDGWFNQNSPDTELVTPSLNVTNGSNLLLGVQKLTLPALSLTNGSNLTHLQTNTTQVYDVDIDIAGSMTIDETSTIYVNGRGYLGGRRGGNNTDYGRTSGNVTSGCTWDADGASYGGVGGNGSSGGAICPTYGDLTNPVEPGSGGGAWDSNYPGGDGGGIVRLSVGVTLTNNGAISANGSNSGQLSGGGSGGAIYISTSTFAGNGTVSANGGVGGANGHYNGYLEAGGGGGRIAIYYDTRTYTGTANAYGGAGYSGGNSGAGTVYWKGNSQNYGDLIVDNNGLSISEASTPLPSNPTSFDDLTISGNARMLSASLARVSNFTIDNGWFTQDSSSTPLIIGTLNLSNGANLTHFSTTTSVTNGIDINVTGDMNIDAASSINVNGRGYLGGRRGGNNSDYGRTSGNVTSGCTWDADGASYGGVGGNGSSGGAICPTYGDLTNPVEPGSGGGAWDGNYPGGSGGGLVRLIVEGTLTNNGAILANGGNSGQLSGGGSGGAIYINTSTLDGNGTVLANGGAGGANGHYNGYLEAGGGGGRIAIYYNTETYTGTAATYGGSNYGGGTYGGAGTVYWKGDLQTYGDLIIDNNGQTSSGISTTSPYMLLKGTSDSSGGISGAVLTDSAVSWEPDSLIGLALNPNRNQSDIFYITANTENTITVSADMSSAASDGNAYSVGFPGFDDVTINGRATVGLDDFPLNAESITISGNSTLTHFDATTSQVSLLRINASILDIDSSSSINVNGRGYLAGYNGGNSSYYGRTTGNTTTGGSYRGAGGSHGGLGGTGYSTTVGSTYGNDIEPTEPGAGGGSYDSGTHRGGDGGGYLYLKVSNTFTNNGSITSNGSNGRSGGIGGGGAGGGILIKAGTFEGSGTVTANGGNGGTYCCGYRSGGGGGGRISYLYTANNFTGSFTAFGGSGQDGGANGSNGTIYSGETSFIDLSVTKSDSPDPAFVDENLTYTITVTNDGPSDATGVVVTDMLPAEVTLVSAVADQGSCSGTDTVTCNVGDIGNGLDVTVTITVTPDSAGDITNTVSVSGNETDLNSLNDQASANTLVYALDAEADISVAKTDSSDPVTAGQVLTYTITVTNAGPSPAPNVVLTDIVPVEITDPEYSVNSGLSWNEWTGSAGLGLIASGGSSQVLIRGEVDPSATGTINNSASAASDISDPAIGNNTAAEITTVDTSADVSVFKTDLPDPVAAGEEIVYTLDVNNAGPSDALSVEITDNVPAQVQNVQYSTDGGINWSSWAGSMNAGTIIAGDSLEIMISGTVGLSTTGTISNSASVTSTTSDPDLSFNIDTIETLVNTKADLSIIKTDSPDPVTVDDSLTYTITVTNSGPSNAGGVIMTDTLPSGITFISATPDQGACSGTSTLTCNLGDIPVGSDAVVTVVIIPLTAGTITNTATVTGDDPDPDLSNNTVVEETAGTPKTDLTVTEISWLPASGIVDGQDVTLTASISNIGSAPSVNDFDVDFLIDGASVGIQRIEESVAGGDSIQISTLWTAIPGTHSVEVVIDVSGEITETDEGNNSISDTLPAILSSDLIVSGISQLPLAPAQGETVTFTATIENAGAGSDRDFSVLFEMDGSSIGSDDVIGGLSAGGSVQVSGTWTAQSGDHTARVTADSTDNIIESDEGNNILSEALVNIPLPDLTVSSITWDPANPVQGELVTLTATVSNNGGGTVKDFAVLFKVDGTGIGTANVTGGLPGSGSVQVTRTWTAEAGSHTVEAEADSSGLVPEADENNNIGSQALPEVLLPDLIISDITWDPADPANLESVTFTATVENAGSTTLKNFNVIFKIDGAAIGTSTVTGGIAGSASVQVTGTWTAGLGIHTIEAAADSTGVVPESNETNNARSEVLSEIVLPDLSISGIAWDPASPFDGNTVTLTATIANIGAGAAAENFYIRFNIDGSSIGILPVSQRIAAGGSVEITHTWTAQSGIHTVEVIADVTGAVPETNEGNNSLSQILPDIPTLDLVVSDITWEGNIIDGQIADFTAILENIGTGDTQRSFKVRFEIDGTLIGEQTLFGLDAGQQKQAGASWTALSGDHDIEVIIDSDEEVAETDETNNSRVESLPNIEDITPPADPLVDTVSTPTNISTQTLTGTKEADSSIWINDLEVIAVNSSTVWSQQVTLTEGDNTFNIYSKDGAGNQSGTVSVTIVYDITPPIQVTGVTTSTDGDGTTLSVNWSGYDEPGQGDIANYRVYMEELDYADVSALIPVVTLPAGNFTHTVTGLVKSNIYYFAVVAVDLSGNALNAVTTVSASPTDIVPPADVTGLSVESFDARLVFTWNHSVSADLAGYKVYFNNASEGVVLPPQQNSVEETGLDPATGYPVRITALDDSGNESNGRTITGITLLANPANLTAVANNGYVDLSWDNSVPPGYVSYYSVYYSDADFSNVDGMTPVHFVSGTSKRVTGLVNGTTYYFAVTVTNISAGEQKSVATVSAMPEQRPNVVNVTGYYVSPVSATDNYRLTIQFDSSMDITVEPTTDLVSSGSINPVVPAGGTWLTTFQTNDTYTTPDIVLSQGMDGTIRLSVSGAADSDGNPMFPVSDVFEFELDATPPDNPSASITSVGCGTATLSWDGYAAPGDLTGFQIYRSDSGSFSTVDGVSFTDLIGPAARSHIIAPLALETTYYAAVAAIDDVGNFTPSVSSYQIFIDRSVPQPVTAIIGAGNEPDEAVLSWAGYDASDLCGFSGFRIYMEETDFTSVNGLTPLVSTSAAERQYVLEGLDRSRTYYLAVVGFNETDEFDESVTTVSWSDPYAGDITSDMTIGGGDQREIFVYQPMTVLSGAALTIMPGTTIYFGSGAGITVDQGSLIALGEPLYPIFMTSSEDMDGGMPLSGDWNGVVINSGGGSSDLRNVFIMWGQGLTVDGSSPNIEALTAESNSAAGLLVRGTGSVSTTEALLRFNATGASVETGGVLDISGSVIKNNTTNASSDNSVQMTATGNWWGALDQSSIASRITGDVDYTGFLGYEPILTPAIGTASGETRFGVRDVDLVLAARNADEMRISEDSAFTDSFFDIFADTSLFTLSPIGGFKTIYAQFRSPTGTESAPVSLTVEYVTDGPVITGFSLTEGQTINRPIIVTGAATSDVGVASIEFYVNDELVQSSPGGAFNDLWDIRALPAGILRVKLLAADTIGIPTILERNVIVEPLPPQAPQITSPADGLITGSEPISVFGNAEAGSDVKLTRNGFVVDIVTADAAGEFEVVGVDLVEGDNRFVATSQDIVGISPNSNSVTVTFDSGPPLAPDLREAIVNTGNGVYLAWRPNAEGETPSFYRIYRAAEMFTDPAQATLLEDNYIADVYIDNNPADSQYYYGIVSLDAAGNASPLSNVLSLDYDATKPVFNISYDRTSPVGTGMLNMTLTVNELLTALPGFTIRPLGANSPVSIGLTQQNALMYTGSFEVLSGTASGTAAVFVSGTDSAGNRYSGPPAGPNLVIDTDGPSGALVFGLSAPVQVQASLDLDIDLTLNEAAGAGTEPLLRFIPPAGDIVTIALSGDNAGWSGSLPLDPAMGSGVGTFTLSVSDGLGNQGSVITAGKTLEIYTTEFPSPAPVPGGISSTSLPGGVIRINWGSASGADSYRVYRKSGVCDSVPSELLINSMAGTSYNDTTPSDGTYCYAVSSLRLGAESYESVMVSGISDSIPPEIPQSLSAEFGLRGIDVSWVSPAAGEMPARYYVYRNGLRVRTVNSTGPALYNITDYPPAGGNYDYTVASVDAIGNENESGPASIALLVGAVNNLQALIVNDSVPIISWSSSDANAVGFNIYNGDVKLNAELLTSPSFEDAFYAGSSRIEYIVTAVNSEGDESPPRSIDVFPIAISAVANPDESGNSRPLITKYFSDIEVTVANNEPTDWMTMSELQLRLSVNGSQVYASNQSSNRTILAMTSYVENIIVPISDSLDAHILKVSAVQPGDGNSQVIYQRDIVLEDVIIPANEVTLSVDQVPLAGGYSTVNLCVHNNGYLDIEIITSRSNGSEPGDIYVAIDNEEGLEISSRAFVGVPEGTTLIGSTGYTRVGSGESLCVDILVLVPESLQEGSVITFVGVVDAFRTYYALGTAVAGPGQLIGTMQSGITLSEYYGTAQADKDEYVGNEVVTISGQAINRSSGLPEPDVPLKIGLYLRGFKLYEEVTTDQDGNYSYEYIPSAGVSGEFTIWAAHPDVFDIIDQDSFIYHRMFSTPATGTIRSSKNTTLNFNVTLINPGDYPLTGFTSQFRAYTVDEFGDEIDEPAIQGDVLFPDGFQVAPGRNANVQLQLTAALDAPDEANVEYTIISGQGPEADFRATVTLVPAAPALTIVSPSAGYVEASVDRGTLATVPVTIRNFGLDELTDAEITLPQNLTWITTNLPQNAGGTVSLGSIPAGETKTFEVVIAPPVDMPFGDNNDKFVITGSNLAQQLDVNVYALVTSQLNGSVMFKVYNNLGLMVEGASVRVFNNTIHEEITSPDTDANGEVILYGLDTGAWTYQITAPGHSSMSGVVNVVADQTVLVENELNKTLVTITFNVVPIPFTDRYEIKIEQKFETRVPVPVLVVDPVIVDLGVVEPGFETVYTVKVSNFGLKALEDFWLEITDLGWGRMEPLITYLPRLNAMETIEVPYRVTYRGPEGQLPGAITPGGIDPCGNPMPGMGEAFDAIIERDQMLQAAMGGRSSSIISRAEQESMARAAVIISQLQGPDGRDTIAQEFAQTLGAAFACGSSSDSGGGSRRIGSSGSTQRSGGTPSTPTYSVGAGGTGCFVEGTPVLMADGSLQTIETVEAGDQIMTYDGSAGTVTEAYTRESDHLLELRYMELNGDDKGALRRLETTDEHLFWSRDENDWLPGRMLKTGDVLLMPDGKEAEITEIYRTELPVTVYNFDVDEYESYYANGVLVHQKCGGSEETEVEESLRDFLNSSEETRMTPLEEGGSE